MKPPFLVLDGLVPGALDSTFTDSSLRSAQNLGQIVRRGAGFCDLADRSAVLLGVRSMVLSSASFNCKSLSGPISELP